MTSASCASVEASVFEGSWCRRRRRRGTRRPGPCSGDGASPAGPSRISPSSASLPRGDASARVAADPRGRLPAGRGATRRVEPATEASSVPHVGQDSRPYGTVPAHSGQTTRLVAKLYLQGRIGARCGPAAHRVPEAGTTRPVPPTGQVLPC